MRWSVRLLEQTQEPAFIPPHGRCLEWDSLQHWPAYSHSTTPIARIRARLIAEFGPTCLACRHSPGVLVDHDHATNLVRGLLCRFCNSHVDKCPHPTGCPWADYLNDPPAARLRITYPNRGRRVNQQKLDYLRSPMSRGRS